MQPASEAAFICAFGINWNGWAIPINEAIKKLK